MIARKRDDLIALCQKFSVTRLEVFGSAARGDSFDVERSDVDLLVTFSPEFRNDFGLMVDFKEAFEAVFGRPVDLVEREGSRRAETISVGVGF